MSENNRLTKFSNFIKTAVENNNKGIPRISLLLNNNQNNPTHIIIGVKRNFGLNVYSIKNKKESIYFIDSIQDLCLPPPPKNSNILKTSMLYKANKHSFENLKSLIIKLKNTLELKNTDTTKNTHTTTTDTTTTADTTDITTATAQLNLGTSFQSDFETNFNPMFLQQYNTFTPLQYNTITPLQYNTHYTLAPYNTLEPLQLLPLPLPLPLPTPTPNLAMFNDPLPNLAMFTDPLPNLAMFTDPLPLSLPHLAMFTDPIPLPLPDLAMFTPSAPYNTFEQYLQNNFF